MSGYQFYEEFRDDERTVSAGNIIAVTTDAPIVHEGGIHCHVLRTMRPPEGGAELVAQALLRAEYLGTHCRAVSEERAREVEPVIFAYLDRLA